MKPGDLVRLKKGREIPGIGELTIDIIFAPSKKCYRPDPNGTKRYGSTWASLRYVSECKVYYAQCLSADRSSNCYTIRLEYLEPA